MACGALMLALTACAIPTQKAPSTLPPSKVPFGLLNRNLPTTTTSQPKPTPSVPVKVFFLNSTDQLDPVQRFEPPPASLTAVLTTMLEGPSSQETAQGVVTAIPGNVRVLSASGSQSLVTVNMNTAFGQIIGNNIELAVAQIVATIAAENGCGTEVLFEIDGLHTSVPVANGQQVGNPVTLAQFVATLEQFAAICP